MILEEIRAMIENNNIDAVVRIKLVEEYFKTDIFEVDSNVIKQKRLYSILIISGIIFIAGMFGLGFKYIDNICLVIVAIPSITIFWLSYTKLFEDEKTV